MKNRLISVFNLSWLILLILLLAVPRGCSSTKVVVGVDKTGRSGLFVFQDASLLEKLKARELISAGEGEVTKKDYLFWVDFDFQARAGLKGVTGGGPYYLRLQLPGKIYQSNADQIEDGQAYWVLSSTAGKNLVLKTRAYRYDAILAFFIAIVVISYSYYLKKLA